VSSCKERICVLESELSDIEATFAHEKHEIEDILEKAGKAFSKFTYGREIKGSQITKSSLVAKNAITRVLLQR
jgi:hypothetical protein